MKKLTCSILIILSVAVTCGFVAKPAMAQDLSAFSPGAVMLFENDRVRVSEATRHPGEKEPMHTHPAYVAYFFGPCKVKITFPDGKIKDKEFNAGEVMWSDGVTHAVEIVGTTDQHVSLIELKK